MGRIRITGTGEGSSFFLKKFKSGALAEGCVGENENHPLCKNEPDLSSSDFLKTRLKIKSNSRKKRFLIKLHQEKIQVKSERIRNLRKSKLERFKIDFIPLCSDEDWEMMAKFYSKNKE